MQYFVEIEARSKFIFSGRSGVNTTCIILTIQTITANAQIPIVDTIIARIGAGDNLQRGISTFQHEMIETETIFRCASGKKPRLI